MPVPPFARSARCPKNFKRASGSGIERLGTSADPAGILSAGSGTSWGTRWDYFGAKGCVIHVYFVPLLRNEMAEADRHIEEQVELERKQAEEMEAAR